ncbi:MAG: trehalose-phosphatase, partial [Solirubrobacterales bacterium]
MPPGSGPKLDGARGAAIVDALRADPSRSAILTDIDGTLAPIVDTPEQAAVPERASRLLERLSRRYGIVGCVSGRPASEARRLVGVESIAYAGNHGLELLLPGDHAPRPDPSLAGREGGAAEFIAGLDASELAALGLRPEDKGPIQALHWRGAEDERAAEA